MSDEEESTPIYTDSFRSFPHHELASKVPLLRKSQNNNDDYDDEDIVSKRPVLPSYEKAEQYRLSQLNVTESNAGMSPQYYPLTSTTVTLGRIATDIAIYFEMLFAGSIMYLICGILMIPLMAEYYRNSPDDYAFFYRLGITSTKHHVTDTASITAILLILTLSILILITRYRWFRLRRELETLHTGIHHYSVILYNISASLRETETVSQYFKNLKEDVVSVLLIPRKLNRLVTLYSQQEKLENEIDRLKLGGQTNNSEIDAIVNTLHKVEKNIQIGEFSPKMSGVAIVTFEHNSSTAKALRTLNASCCPCVPFCVCATCNKKRFYGRRVFAQQAAPPSDVIYENLKYGAWSHTWRGFVLFLGSVFIIVPMVTLMRGISQYSSSEDETIGQYFRNLPSHLFFSITILIVKKLIALMLQKAVVFQKLHLRSDQQYNLHRFTFWTEYMFLTGAVAFSSNHALFSDNWAITVQDKLFSAYIAILVASAMSPISPFYRIRKFVKSKLAVTQKDLNEAVSPPEFNPGTKAGELLALQHLTITYGYLFPLGYFFLAMCLHVRYWCHKYECLRINQKAVSYSSFMTRTVPIQHFVLIFTLGAAMQVNAKYHGWYAAIALPSALLAVGLLVHDWIAPMFHLSNIDYTQGRPLSSQPDLQHYQIPTQSGKSKPANNNNNNV